jgi:hypothetical protein
MTTPASLDTSVVLTDPTLFGNESAEDERDEIFNSYAFERSEVELFSDSKLPICFARAYKGEGKSALLRLTARRVRKLNPTPIVVFKTALEIAPEIARDDYGGWVKAWKAAILGMFAVEIGSQIGVAWSDDAMSLVEEAEKTGFRSRSVLMSILDRLSLPPVPVAGAAINLPGRKVLGAVNPSQAVKRWSDGKTELWLFVDDVDKNFRNIDSDKIRVGAFFDACRELMKEIPELHIRSAIRPNVWTILRLDFESLSHVDQYMTNLTWSEGDVRTLLFRRISGYLKRHNRWSKIERTLIGSDEDKEKAVIALAFSEAMKWGAGTRPPHVVLYTLSKHRPRWVIELSKVAASGATKRQHTRIMHEDIVAELATFGARRIDDTEAEFKSQCPEIGELISAFSREKEQLSTDELLRVVSNKILAHLTPRIAGIGGKPTSLQVASLLFEIGLFYGRRDYSNGDYLHVGYSERPQAFKSRANVDDGLTWEIHPVFRQALEMRDIAGFERLPTRNK